MKQTLCKVLILIIVLPIALFDYLVFAWFWTGDGTFSLIATPIAFVLYLLLLIFIKKRFTLSHLWNIISRLAIILLTPILSMFTVSLIALLFGIDISIA